MNRDVWLKNTVSIAAIFSFRMLGLFMLIPVFTLYTAELKGATPILMGIALGAYGCSQGILQIPFGLLSDRYGRKPILYLGLSLFALGSLLGALTSSIEGMIVARIIQGGGAIGSVLIALLADLTHQQDRTKAMAVIGATIGISFAIAIVISPAISASYGLSGIFYFSMGLALLGLIIVHRMIPSPSKMSPSTISMASFKKVLRKTDLLRINAGIFFQHLVLTATFFAIPLLLKKHLQTYHLSNTGWFYLPIMLIGFLLMIPCITLAERKHHHQLIFIGSVCATALSQFVLSVHYDSLWVLSAGLLIYFAAFNTLEATLPSLASKHAEVQYRGCSMGVYSTCQFLGIFTGGLLSGFVFQWFSYRGIFLINAAITCVWLLIASLDTKACPNEKHYI